MKQGARQQIEAASRAFLEAESILLVSHRHPDGDAIGSSLALASGLAALGKDCEVVNISGVPANLSWLPMAEQVRPFPTQGRQFDVVAYLDCATKERIAYDEDLSLRAPVCVNIDHHPGNSCFGAVNLIDEEACASGELVFYLLKSMKAPIDYNAATAIYTAILTDTGSFRFSNATPRAFAVAAELASMGINPSWIAKMVYDMEPLGKLRLLSKSLETLHISDENSVAGILVTRSMLKETGTTVEDVDGLVNYPRSINGVSVGLLFREECNNRYRVAFRSKDSVDVAKIATEFGGGGHRNAAGATVLGDYEMIKSTIFEKAQQAIDEAENKRRKAS